MVTTQLTISSCEFQGINSDLAQDFCWIHGTSYIPPQYQVRSKKTFYGLKNFLPAASEMHSGAGGGGERGRRPGHCVLSGELTGNILTHHSHVSSSVGHLLHGHTSRSLLRPVLHLVHTGGRTHAVIRHRRQVSSPHSGGHEVRRRGSDGGCRGEVCQILQVDTPPQFLVLRILYIM